jgi:hypothetical protein
MEDVTLGEVYRVLLEVREQTMKTNGRVDKHDTDIALLNLRMDGFTQKASAAFGVPSPPPERAEDGKVSTKAVAGGLVVVGAAGGVVVNAILKLAQWWFAK